MKKLSVVLLSIVSSALLITGGSALAYSQPSGMRSKVVSPRKMQARQLKAQKKYAKAQRKAQKKMLKRSRKGTSYPKHTI